MYNTNPRLTTLAEISRRNVE